MRTQPVSIFIHCTEAVVLVIIMQCLITICSHRHVTQEPCGGVGLAAKKSQIDGITITLIRHNDPCVPIVQQHTVESIRCVHTYVPSIQNVSSSIESDANFWRTATEEFSFFSSTHSDRMCESNAKAPLIRWEHSEYWVSTLLESFNTSKSSALRHLRFHGTDTHTWNTSTNQTAEHCGSLELFLCFCWFVIDIIVRLLRIRFEIEKCFRCGLKFSWKCASACDRNCWVGSTVKKSAKEQAAENIEIHERELKERQEFRGLSLENEDKAARAE